MNLKIVKICSILISFFSIVSCSSPKLIAQDLKPLNPSTQIYSSTSELKETTRNIYSNKLYKTILEQEKEIHLLRTEIDGLKKQIKFLEISKGIDKVQNKLNRITKE